MRQRRDKAGPQFVKFLPAVLQGLRDLGGSARPAEVCDRVAEIVSISAEERAQLLPSGQARFDNRVAWARFYLAKAGYIDSSRRGVWTLTEQGRNALLTDEQAQAIFRDTQATFVASETGSTTAQEISPDENLAPESLAVSTPLDHRKRLIDILLSLSASGFERFCQRVLREAGFQDVTVTGRSGDGGIDGIGVLQVNPLVSFKVLFQCKRYQGSVSPSQVRDFRGAMQGRADKGIIITTGSFTSDAKKESIRDGVPPIELVDGEKLVEMLENLELGLVPIKAFRLDDRFFEEYKI